MKPKILAFYLPQFHRVKENDEWWGEGFTEWTAVKAAEKMFEGHIQPRVPLNHNYYDLMEYDTMAWQAGLMKEYQIDGMCMYHYWFQNGRRILEKPAENLLRWTDIQMPFCFCWANETWSRTWKKYMEVNVWIDKRGAKRSADSDGILLKQAYGREKEWEEHFQYLLPYFNDSRYIKLDGKPVFSIYNPRHIFQLWEMRNYLERRAKENGFPGIYMVGMGERLMDGIDAVCIRQPCSAVTEYQKKHGCNKQGLQVYPYDELCKIQMETRIRNQKTYFSSAVDFDSTPRMGKKGMLLQGASPKKFRECFNELYKKSMVLGNEFLFINAWNEWGEGMYLEPDEENGYGYLESVRGVVEEYEKVKVVRNDDRAGWMYEAEEEKKERIWEEPLLNLGRHDRLLENWMSLRDHKINFSSYFEKYGYKNIAIYGMGRLGAHLLQELEEGDIRVCFGIDQNKQSEDYKIEVFSPCQEMPAVDAVVVTIFGEYRNISEILRKRINCPIITLEEIIQELLFEC